MKYTKETLNRLFEEFKKEYAFMLESNAYVAGQDEAYREGEEWLYNNPETVEDMRYLVRLRMDGFDTSNEISAMGYALASLGMI